MIVNFICSQIVAHFCIAKTGHLRCCLYTFWAHYLCWWRTWPDSQTTRPRAECAWLALLSRKNVARNRECQSPNKSYSIKDGWNTQGRKWDDREMTTCALQTPLSHACVWHAWDCAKCTRNMCTLKNVRATSECVCAFAFKMLGYCLSILFHCMAGAMGNSLHSLSSGHRTFLTIFEHCPIFGFSFTHSCPSRFSSLGFSFFHSCFSRFWTALSFFVDPSEDHT